MNSTISPEYSGILQIFGFLAFVTTVIAAVTASLVAMFLTAKPKSPPRCFATASATSFHKKRVIAAVCCIFIFGAGMVLHKIFNADLITQGMYMKSLGFSLGLLVLDVIFYYRVWHLRNEII